MLTPHLLFCLPLYQQPVDKPSLRYFQENFILRVGGRREIVPIQLPRERPVLSVSFRKDKNYAVWDDRGLTIRIGKVAKSTRMEAVATSPKAFSREEILENSDLIGKKIRRAGATALSGSKRVGNNVFFLVRWEDRTGKPWMESLVSVDLTAKTFHPKFHARLTGLSLADKNIDDRLFVLSERLSVIARQGDQWGIAAFEPEDSRFEFKNAGNGLESYQPISSRIGVFVEKTDYETRVGGRIDLQTLIRKHLVEGKGNLKFPDTGDPLIALFTGNGSPRLINTESGAELELLTSAALRRTRLGLVVWSPFKDPKRAWLYSFERWQRIATWQQE